MDHHHEDIRSNDFYIALTNLIPNLERIASRRRLTIFVPRQPSLPTVCPKHYDKVLRAHVADGEATLNRPPRRLLIDHAASTVRVRSSDGFAEPRTVKILARETLRVCDDDADEGPANGVGGGGGGGGGGASASASASPARFRVLCISRPLEGPGQVPMLEDGVTELWQPLPVRGVAAWLQLLGRDDTSRLGMQELNGFAHEFNTTYVLVSGSEVAQRDVLGKIRAAAEACARLLLDHNPRFAAARDDGYAPYRDTLLLACEAAATTKVHAKIWPALVGFYAREEEGLRRGIKALRAKWAAGDSAQRRASAHAAFTRGRSAPSSSPSSAELEPWMAQLGDDHPLAFHTPSSAGGRGASAPGAAAGAGSSSDGSSSRSSSSDGLSAEFARVLALSPAPLPRTRRALMRLPEARCPLQVLLTLQQAARAITTDIDEAGAEAAERQWATEARSSTNYNALLRARRRRSTRASKGEGRATPQKNKVVAADDMLQLFIRALAFAAPDGLVAASHYCQLVSTALLPGELLYHAANLQAAVAYMQAADPRPPPPPAGAAAHGAAARGGVHGGRDRRDTPTIISHPSNNLSNGTSRPAAPAIDRADRANPAHAYPAASLLPRNGPGGAPDAGDGASSQGSNPAAAAVGRSSRSSSRSDASGGSKGSVHSQRRAQRRRSRTSSWNPSDIGETPLVGGPGTPMSERARWKARFVRFYSFYRPAQCARVDAILDKHAGDYPGVWRAMLAKYGPEIGGPPAMFGFEKEAAKDPNSSADTITPELLSKAATPGSTATATPGASSSAAQQQQQQEAAGATPPPVPPRRLPPENDDAPMVVGVRAAR